MLVWFKAQAPRCMIRTLVMAHMVTLGIFEMAVPSATGTTDTMVTTTKFPELLPC